MSQVTGKAKKNCKVTVGICVKNSEKTVREAIESVINQDYPHDLMEIAAVDGCSKDKTLFIVSSAASKTDIRVKIYSDEGRGLGAARQIVVDNAEGEYIVWVDGDMRLSYGFIKTQVGYMEENSQVGVAVGNYSYNEGTLVATLRSLGKYIKYHELASARKPSNLPPDANGAIYRVKAIRQVGGFDQNIRGASEDADLITRIKAKGWLFSLNQKAHFYHGFKETWSDLWVEQLWFGYGGHYISHKYKDLFTHWSNAPLVSFLDGLKRALKAYKSTRQRKSFLLPLLFVFQKIAWWHGFVKGHLEGYGHEAVGVQG